MTSWPSGNMSRLTCPSERSASEASACKDFKGVATRTRRVREGLVSGGRLSRSWVSSTSSITAWYGLKHTTPWYKYMVQDVRRLIHVNTRSKIIKKIGSELFDNQVRK